MTPDAKNPVLPVVYALMRTCGHLLLLLALLAQAAPAATNRVDPHAADAARWDAENLTACTNRADVFLAPGIVADRAAQAVRLLATSVKIGPGEPLEFLLNAPASDHGYESLAISRVPAAALHAALVFIGQTPGRSPDPRAMMFWPKGERLRITIRAMETNAGAAVWTDPRPVEDFLLDGRTNAPPTVEGFVFVEAGTVAAGSGTNRVYAPDALEPHAIVSLYNEPNTVCDVPRIAAQSSVYGQQRTNPERTLPAGTLMEFTFRPEPRADSPRVRDGVLTASAAGGAARPAPARFALTGVGMYTTVLDADSLAAIVAAIVDSGADPYLRIRFEPGLRLDEIHEACLLLGRLERADGIRVEPPEPDQLYYRAFLPNEENRKREDRVAQPLELRLRHGTNGVQAILVEIQEQWREDKPEPDLTVIEHPLGSPADIAPALDKLAPKLPALLVFAPPDLTLGDAMAYIAPARKTLSFVHVYLEGTEASR